MTLVSLVATVLNADRFLALSIESVIRQTWQDWELIVWDDGSTDDSAQIAQHFAQRDHRIKAISAGHLGRPAALKSAIEQSSGEYLGFLDADDLLAPDAIASTVQVLNQHSDVGMVYTQYWDMAENGEILNLGHRCKIPYSAHRLLIDFMTFHFRLMRREVYDLVGGIGLDYPCAQDYDLCLKLSEVTEFHHISEPLYFYRKNSSGISQTKRQQQIEYSTCAVNAALQRRGMTGQYRLEVTYPSVFRLVKKASDTQ